MEMTVALRQLTAGDLDDLCCWRNDPVVTRYLAKSTMRIEEAREWFVQLPRSGAVAHAILANNDYVGYTVLDHVDRTNLKCEVGIVIGRRDCWGQGIGKAAVRLVTAMAFEQLGMHRVLAVASARNAASIACFLSAGYKEEGRLRDANLLDGEFIDLVLLSLLRHEWNKPV